MSLLDKTALKQALCGRWSEVFSSLGGCPSEILDGKNHPCPKCGGRDRFRLIDTEAGALFCNQCFFKENGDGFAALQWLTGKCFTDVLGELHGYLGNGHSNGNGKSGKIDGGQNAHYQKSAKVFATAQAAVAELERQHGKRSAFWTYHNVNGDPVGTIIRWDKLDGKDIRPVSLVNGQWTTGGMPAPRPLYCLPEIAAAQRVYICEGEKAADAARSIGLIATTSPHGSNSAGKADWTPLAGKEIVILPDNDAAGKSYCDTVKKILATLKPTPSIKVVELPGLPEGGDIVDWNEAQGDSCEPEEMRRQVESLVMDAEQSVQNEHSAKTVYQPPTYHALTCAELDAGNYDLEYLIDGILVAGQPCILAGGQKTLKTTLLVDLGISLATGGCSLGRFPVTRPVRVALMSGESGLGTLQETARRVAWAAGKNLAEIDGLIWSEDLPRFGEPMHETALGNFIATHQLEVLAIDPAYLAMPGCKPEDLFAQGGLLRGMSEVCRAANCLMILAHHNKKNRPDPNAPPELSDIAWAGFSEFARQWLLVGRRQPYEPGTGLHRLWLSVGGSAGHNGLWALDVAEGTRASEGGRFWQVNVMTSDEVKTTREDSKRAAKQADLEKQIDADRKEIVSIAIKLKVPDTKNGFRDRFSGGHARFDRAFTSLVNDDIMQPAEIRKGNNRIFDGWRIKDEAPE